MNSGALPFALSVAQTGLSELNPITGPERLPTVDSGGGLRWVAIGVLIVLGAAVVLARRRRQRIAQSEIIDLEEPFAELLTTYADSRRFTELLSQLVRQHLAQRFGISADFMTAAELAELLSRRSIGRSSSLGWIAILNRCDRAKFAGEAMSREESTEAVRTAQTLLAEDLIVSESLPPKEFGVSRQNGSSEGESAADVTPAAKRAL